jgi:hypothetical protein
MFPARLSVTFEFYYVLVAAPLPYRLSALIILLKEIQRYVLWSLDEDCVPTNIRGP